MPKPEPSAAPAPGSSPPPPSSTTRPGRSLNNGRMMSDEEEEEEEEAEEVNSRRDAPSAASAHRPRRFAERLPSPPFPAEEAEKETNQKIEKASALFDSDALLPAAFLTASDADQETVQQLMIESRGSDLASPVTSVLRRKREMLPARRFSFTSGAPSKNGSNNSNTLHERSSSASRLPTMKKALKPADKLDGENLKSRKNSIGSIRPVDLGVLASALRLNQQQQHGSAPYASHNEEEEEEEETGLPAPPPPRATVENLAGLSATKPEEPCCLVCLGRFTSKKPAIRIPCSKSCSDSPVHAKCIYEWKALRAAAPAEDARPSATSGTCPLCRSPLGDVDYEPSDPLRTAELMNSEPERRVFVLRPSPKHCGVVRTYVAVVETGKLSKTPLRYEMYLQAPTSIPYPGGPLPFAMGLPAPGDVLLMTAVRRTTRALRSRIHVSLHRDPAAWGVGTPGHLGSVDASWLGCDWTFSTHELVSDEDPSPETTTDASETRAKPAARGASRWAAARFLAARSQTHPDGPSPRSRARLMKREIGSVRFEQNRVGPRAGPRRICVCLPPVSLDASLPAPAAAAPKPETEIVYENEETAPSNTENEEEDEDDDDEEDDEKTETVYKTEPYRPLTKRDSIVKQLKARKRASERGDDAAMQRATSSAPGLIFARNVAPYFLPHIHAFSLDFSGRVLYPSNKNFILASDLDPPGTNALLFGKVSRACDARDPAKKYSCVYTLDFQWPLSPFQAFAVALASCDRKLGVA